MEDLDAVRALLIRRFPLVDDHPDVAGVLRQPDLLSLLGPALAQPFRHRDVTQVIAPEARGPILGALVASELGAGLTLVRKEQRNHPGADLWVESAPTWRGHAERFQARSFDLTALDQVLIIDDWITTGSTIGAIIDLIDSTGATLVGVAALVDKAGPATIERLRPHTLVRFAELVGGDTAGRDRRITE